jgi:hypothetical protein
MKARLRLLDEAARLINGERDAVYGPPVINHTRIAELWSAYLGYDIEPSEVAIMLGLVKISRLAASPDHQDSYTDLAAYAAIAWECVQEDSNDD